MNNDIRFTLGCVESAKPGQHIVLSLTLTNEGGAAVLLPTRFAIEPTYGDIRITVRRDKKELPFRYRIRMAPLRASDFVRIDAKETLIGGIAITRWYSFTEPGNYVVAAEFVCDEMPDALTKENVFQGRLKSNTVQIKLHD